jgi:hypothetical protein
VQILCSRGSRCCRCLQISNYTLLCQEHGSSQVFGGFIFRRVHPNTDRNLSAAGHTIFQQLVGTPLCPTEGPKTKSPNILPESYDKSGSPAKVGRITVADTTHLTPHVISSSTLTDIFRNFRQFECQIRGIIKSQDTAPTSLPITCTFITRSTLRNHLVDGTKTRGRQSFCVMQGRLLKIDRFLYHMPECDY